MKKEKPDFDFEDFMNRSFWIGMIMLSLVFVVIIGFGILQLRNR